MFEVHIGCWNMVARSQTYLEYCDADTTQASVFYANNRWTFQFEDITPKEAVEIIKTMRAEGC